MQLLVRIDRPGDVGPFLQAIEGRQIDEIRLHNPWESPWIRDALVQGEHPHDATFYVVRAPNEAALRDDVSLTSRGADLPDGEPGFVVLATAY